MSIAPFESSDTASIQGIVALRRELAHAERQLKERAEREAVRLARVEHEEWRKAQAKCLEIEHIRRLASARLEKLSAREPERLPGEAALARMALSDAERWELRDSAEYTIISFANLRDRIRYLKGGDEREALVRETIERGGVYTEAFGGRHFMEIVR